MKLTDAYCSLVRGSRGRCTDISKGATPRSPCVRIPELRGFGQRAGGPGQGKRGVAVVEEISVHLGPNEIRRCHARARQEIEGGHAPCVFVLQLRAVLRAAGLSQPHPRDRGESFLRVYWVAVPKALRARRVNRTPRAPTPGSTSSSRSHGILSSTSRPQLWACRPAPTPPTTPTPTTPQASTSREAESWWLGSGARWASCDTRVCD
jgi:hypothetical protein